MIGKNRINCWPYYNTQLPDRSSNINILQKNQNKVSYLAPRYIQMKRKPKTFLWSIKADWAYIQMK